jgi:hypothetical protein
MNYKILRFVELLKESLEVDDDVIKELTNELSDELDIDFNITKGYLSKESLKKEIYGDLGQLFKQPTNVTDKKCYMVSIDLKECQIEQITSNSTSTAYPIFDSTKVFKIFNVLSEINQRVGDCYIQLGGHRIHFFVCSDEEIIATDLYKLYTEIKTKFSNLHSDFSYDTTITPEDNKIVIKSNRDSYTDRKLKLALRGIRLLDKYKMTKTTEEGLVFNTIELR